MLGKKPDPLMSHDLIQQLAEEHFVSNVSSFQDFSQAMIFSLASDLVYECNYRLSWWQWLFFPVVSWKLSGLQKLLRKHAGNEQTIGTVRTLVKTLEFRDKAPPDRYLHIVRAHILTRKFTNWQIRQAFNSIALKKSEGKLLPIRIHTSIARSSVLLQWLLGILSLCLAIDFSFSLTTKLSYIDKLGLLDLSIWATLIAYRYGSQYKHGCLVLGRIWPTSNPIAIA